jgi:predicted DNA-binding WGR domain protein
LDQCAGILQAAVMEKHQHSTYLERKHAATNMARFHDVTTTSTLFNETSVIRHWERIGSQGKTLERVFTHRSEAK